MLGVKLLERTKRVVIAHRDRARHRRARPGAAARRRGSGRGGAWRRSDPLSGPLQLGVIPTIGPFLVAAASCRVLREAFPKLKIYLREEQIRAAPRPARKRPGRRGDHRAACIPATVWRRWNWRSTASSSSVRRSHRLASLATRSAPEDMAADDLLLLEDGHCLRDHALAACSLEGARRNSGFQGTSLHTLVQMAANGLGVTLVPRNGDRGRHLARPRTSSPRPLEDDSPPAHRARLAADLGPQGDLRSRRGSVARGPGSRRRTGGSRPERRVRPIDRSSGYPDDVGRTGCGRRSLRGGAR